MFEDKEKQLLKELGMRVRKMRIEKNITQAQLAYELKTSTRHYQRIENGEINTSYLKLLKIAKIFDEPIEKLVKT